MSSKRGIGEFKEQVADSFNRRQNYDKGDFHPQLAHRLVELAQLKSGQKILDIATGTGLVAIAAAEIVGPQGWVVGVDISTGMLDQARQKIGAANLKNIEVQEADGETCNFPDKSFDTILCCSALVYLINTPAALRRWYEFLQPNGQIGITGFAATAFPAVGLLRTVAQRHGVILANPNEPTGTAQKCHSLLQEAGFQDVEVKTEQFGSYINLSQAQGLWDTKFPFNRPLLQLESAELAQVQAEYFAELEALATDKGIWNDITTFLAFGRKLTSELRCLP